jgi:TonB family protein
MFARPRLASFSVSLATHGLILAWVAAGPVREEPQPLYAQAIAPHASKLVWYDFREKLPNVSPTPARRPAKPPRTRVKLATQEIVARTAKARPARQFVWQPAPKLELHTDLRSPNVLAIRAPHAEPPPKPKLFVPPPETPPPTADAPVLAAPPEIRSERNVKGAANLPGMLPAKAPPRKFVAPPAGHPVDKPAPALPDAPAVSAAANAAMAAPPILRSRGAKPSPFGPALPEPPALSEPASPATVSMAIVGLNPSANAPAPAPEGARNAQFSAAPQPRRTGGTDAAADGASLTVPGLLIRSDVADAKPTAMALKSATQAANLRAALRSSLPAPPIAGPHASATRVSSAPEALWHGRDTYAMSVQMPNITSYSGSCLIWFAERREESETGGPLSPPVPRHIVDPKYFPAAMADRVEGKVRLVAVIRKDGRVDSVSLLRHLDDRLDRSAADAMQKWQFEPALRDGQPVDVDALIEIPFRLAPKGAK